MKGIWPRHSLIPIQPMIATDKFLFVHLHKAGGQFVNTALLRYIPGAREIGYHYPRSSAPAPYIHLPVVGFVRNPWDWYVSWYAFNNARQGMNPLFSVLSEGGGLDFKHTIENLLRLTENTLSANRHKTKLLELLPETIEGNRRSGLTRNCIRSMTDGRVGYLTWLYRRMFSVNGKTENTLIGRMETLRADLLMTLEDLAVPISDQLRHYVLYGDRENVSTHGPFQQYYNEDLQHLVELKDSTIVRQFNYSFERERANYFMPRCHGNGSDPRRQTDVPK